MPTWLTIFLALGGSTLIGLLINGAFAFGKRKREEIQSALVQQQNAAQTKQLQTIIQAEIKPLKNELEETSKMVIDIKNNDLPILKNASKDSLRNNLYILYDRCYLYKTDDDIENESHMFESYTALNGNSGCHARHLIFLQLPTEAQFAHEHPEEYKKIKNKEI